jgi:predicted nucleotidyltransferase
MPAEFAKLLEKLSEGGVRYLVVGGVAVGLNGFARYTNDLDIIVEAQTDNIQRLLAVLSSWGEGSAQELDIADFVPPEMGAIRIVEAFALDVFTLMRARNEGQPWDFAELARDARTHFSLKGTEIKFISIARLIALKTGTGRNKDRGDIEILREIQRAGREGEIVPLESIGPAPDGNSDDKPSDEEWML